MSDMRTETYIILKPIAERFNRIANSIRDEEIKSLIKEEMRNQLRQIDFRYEVESILSDFIEENKEKIIGLYEAELKNRFK